MYHLLLDVFDLLLDVFDLLLGVYPSYCMVSADLVPYPSQPTRLQRITGGTLPPKPDWAHMFFSVLPPVDALTTREPARVAAALRAAAARVLSRHAAALRAAAVAEWHVRLRVANGTGAWRVQATMPTGVWRMHTNLS